MKQQAASPSLARLAAAYRYLAYSDRIEGWLYQTTALAMMELIWLQEEAGFAGNLAMTFMATADERASIWKKSMLSAMPFSMIMR